MMITSLRLLFLLLLLPMTGLGHDIRIDRFFGGPLAVTGLTYPIDGELVHIGTTALESLHMHYQVDDSDIVSDYFEGLGINPYIPFHFASGHDWIPAQAGNYSIRVWFTGLNGLPADVPASDTLEVMVRVMDSLPPMQLALLESFSSINCGSCALVTPVLRDIVSTRPEEYAMIYYHPLAHEGSPLYGFAPRDQDSRRDLYGVFYTPYSVIGTVFDGGSEQIREEMLASMFSRPAGFELSGSWYEKDGYVHIDVASLSHAGFDSHSLSLLVVLAEDSVSFDSPPGSNGEKDFFHVMRGFVPDAQGTQLHTPEAGILHEVSFSYEVGEGKINTAQLSVLAFVQDLESREIYQATRLEEVEPEEDPTFINNLTTTDALRVFPNPSRGTIQLLLPEGVSAQELRLYDMSGRLHYRLSASMLNAQAMHGRESIIRIEPDLPQSGIYLLQLLTGEESRQLLISFIK